MHAIAVTVRFLDNRYHGLDTEGKPEWPPSPARLFQALVSCAASGAMLAEEDKLSLSWLEKQGAPIIAAPPISRGQAFSIFMPNNDLDTVDGDPGRISEIRSATKRFHPIIFSADMPILYLWCFDQDDRHAVRICGIADQLYQLGRGVDMAWAVAEMVDSVEAEARLSDYSGSIHRPTLNGTSNTLACPFSGSLVSLIDRYQKGRKRFGVIIEPDPSKNDPGRMKIAGQVFSQAPKPSFKQVSYNCPPVRLLYELRDLTASAGFSAWPFKRASILVTTLRDMAADKLKKSLSAEGENISRVFGLASHLTEADKASRIRIIPLPSIGHQHADHEIRRVLVEIPPNCPVMARDIDWSFSGLCTFDAFTGELLASLVPAQERNMLRHYGCVESVEAGHRVWRTVTPMVLPVTRVRGRKSGVDRMEIEKKAAVSVVQALRHSGVIARPVAIRMQQEPFDAKGSRARDFSSGTRFVPERLWHAEITFTQPISGPLLAGDGRYVGLGLMNPVSVVEGVHSFSIVRGWVSGNGQIGVARALRRAVMSLVQAEIGLKNKLPVFFTGHEDDASPARRGGKSHLAFVFDEVRQRLLVIAPHLMESRQPSFHEKKNLDILTSALTNFRELRAGEAGILKLEHALIEEESDDLFMKATTWITQTEYSPTRHGKRVSPEQATIVDVELELSRRGLPKPLAIEILQVKVGPKGGLKAKLKLEFIVAIKGPLLLGKSCHFGSGLFSLASTVR